MLRGYGAGQRNLRSLIGLIKLVKKMDWVATLRFAALLTLPTNYNVYTWVERGTMRVKCLPQGHNAVPRPGLEPGPVWSPMH